jgi:hypothetical protein
MFVVLIGDCTGRYGILLLDTNTLALFLSW